VAFFDAIPKRSFPLIPPFLYLHPGVRTRSGAPEGSSTPWLYRQRGMCGRTCLSRIKDQKEVESEVEANANFPRDSVIEINVWVFRHIEVLQMQPAGTTIDLKGFVDVPNQASGCLGIETSVIV